VFAGATWGVSPKSWCVITVGVERRSMASFDYDVVIIGSGFGGSVAALRAAA